MSSAAALSSIPLAHHAHQTYRGSSSRTTHARVRDTTVAIISLPTLVVLGQDSNLPNLLLAPSLSLPRLYTLSHTFAPPTAHGNAWQVIGQSETILTHSIPVGGYDTDLHLRTYAALDGAPTVEPMAGTHFGGGRGDGALTSLPHLVDVLLPTTQPPTADRSHDITDGTTDPSRLPAVASDTGTRPLRNIDWGDATDYYASRSNRPPPRTPLPLHRPVAAVALGFGHDRYETFEDDLPTLAAGGAPLATAVDFPSLGGITSLTSLPSLPLFEGLYETLRDSNRKGHDGLGEQLLRGSGGHGAAFALHINALPALGGYAIGAGGYDALDFDLPPLDPLPLHNFAAADGLALTLGRYDAYEATGVSLPGGLSLPPAATSFGSLPTATAALRIDHLHMPVRSPSSLTLSLPSRGGTCHVPARLLAFIAPLLPLPC